MGVDVGKEDFRGAGQVGLEPVQELHAGGRVRWSGDVFVDYEDHVVDGAAGIAGSDDCGFVEDVWQMSVSYSVRYDLV